VSCVSVCLVVCFFTLAFFFAKICFSVKVAASQPVRDSGCQYQRSFSGLDWLCVIFSWLLNIPAACLSLARGYPRPVLSSARGYTRAVLVTVAGLLGSFSAWVGQSSPPVVKRTPLRGLKSGTAQSAG
jgi:hypothetical protein